LLLFLYIFNYAAVGLFTPYRLFVLCIEMKYFTFGTFVLKELSVRTVCDVLARTFFCVRSICVPL